MTLFESDPNIFTTNASLLALARDRAPIPPTFLWSGSYAELDGGSLFDAHPRTWTAHGWNALEHACDYALAATPSTGTLLIRPHARHVLSDIPSLKRFASLHPARFSLFLDPCSMLDTAHLDRRLALDAIRRILEEAPGIGLPITTILAANITPDLRLVPIDQGLLDPTLLHSLFAFPPSPREG